MIYDNKRETWVSPAACRGDPSATLSTLLTPIHLGHPKWLQTFEMVLLFCGILRGREKTANSESPISRRACA